jgi:hypothetical protein
MYVYMHTLQLTAGSKTPGEGAAAAGRTKLKLLLCHYRAQEPRDTRGTGGHAGE